MVIFYHLIIFARMCESFARNRSFYLLLHRKNLDRSILLRLNLLLLLLTRQRTPLKLPSSLSPLPANSARSTRTIAPSVSGMSTSMRVRFLTARVTWWRLLRLPRPRSQSWKLRRSLPRRTALKWKLLMRRLAPSVVQRLKASSAPSAAHLWVNKRI